MSPSPRLDQVLLLALNSESFMFLTQSSCVRSRLRVAEPRWSLSAHVHVSVSLLGGVSLLIGP